MVDDKVVEDRLVMFCMDSKKVPGNSQTLRGYLRAWKERMGGWGKLEDALWGIPNGMTVLELQDRFCPRVKPKAPAAPELKGNCSLCDGKRVMPIGVRDGAWDYAPCSCLRRQGPKLILDVSKFPLPWKVAGIGSSAAGGLL